MKNGTLYAKKLKPALSRIRGSAPQTPLEYADAIEQLIVAVLSQEAGLSSAHRAMRQLREDMVDYNELRVSTPAEVVASIDKHISDAEKPAEALIRVLNAIYRNEFAVTLDRLAGKGVRETKAYLDELDGMTPYVSASVLLWSLGGHAIPVNDRALDQLRREELVDPAADTAEVQAFLERHISAADAKDFALDLAAYAASKNRSTAASREARAKAGKAASKTSRKKSQTTAKSTRKTKTTRKATGGGKTSRKTASKTKRTARG
jgi:endonuclease III